MDSLLRQSMYRLMLVLSVGFMVARIANVELLIEPSMYKANPTRAWPKERPEPWPTFSSNDRARWATVKSLVEEGTFVIGKRTTTPDDPQKKYVDSGILFTDGFKSVDVVLHPERQEFFSTKPPLLTLVAAGEYWVMHKFLKWNISEQRWPVVVTVLLLTNVLPLAICLVLFTRLVEAYGQTDWGRLFVVAVACFGTFLSTFTVTLNNHVPAACCVFMAIYLVAKPRPTDAPLSFFTAGVIGLFSGAAVCLDLPAAALVGALAAVLCWQQPKTLITFIPLALLPMGVQSWVNYQAVGTWEPVYAKFGGEWYEYEGSHWAKRHDPAKAVGIDFANDPKTVYAFHLLFGHHGLFSLTPVWLLSLWGFFAAGADQSMAKTARRWGFIVLAVVVVFYIFKSNNYGGWTSGPRWLFWLTPLLLLALIPGADSVARSRVGRGLALCMLAASIFAVVYPWTNPWRHPWIFQLGEAQQWWKY